MWQDNIKPLTEIEIELKRIGIPHAFTGGAVVPLFLDHPDLFIVRPTKDVDVVIQAASILAYQDIEGCLRDAGWRNDTSEHAPRCRWIHGEILVDVLSSAPVPGEFSSPWFQHGIQYAWHFEAEGQKIPVLDSERAPVYGIFGDQPQCGKGLMVRLLLGSTPPDHPYPKTAPRNRLFGQRRQGHGVYYPSGPTNVSRSGPLRDPRMACAWLPAYV